MLTREKFSWKNSFKAPLQALCTSSPPSNSPATRKVSCRRRAERSAEPSRRAAGSGPATWIPLMCCISWHRCGSGGHTSGLVRTSRGENPASALHSLVTLPRSPAPAPRPQAKPRRPQPPARWGVLAEQGTSGPGSTPAQGLGAAAQGLGRDAWGRKTPFRLGESWRAKRALRCGSPLVSSGPDPRPLSQTDSARPGHVTAEAANPMYRRDALAAELYFWRRQFSTPWDAQSPWLHVSQHLSN